LGHLAERLAEAAAVQGILAAAVPDAVSRGTHYFTDEPTDAQIQAWAAGLRDVAPHFFAPQSPPQQTPAEQERQALLDRLSPSEKLARARAGQPPVQRQRPQPVTLTSEQVAELASLPAMQRLSAYRALQDAAQDRKG
jgi:hypothetical protein